jgi:drug/metabolite transporter (DMT)-like permease
MIWGLDYALAGRVFQHKIAPATLLAMQMLIGGTIFACISAATTLKEDIQAIVSSAATLGLTASALVVFASANLMICLSIQAKNATLAGLIEISYPIFIAIFSYLLFKEQHLSLSVILGGTLILSGIGIIYSYN